MKDFYIRQKNNIWFGSFELFARNNILTACSCRLHGESAIVQDTLNLALHVDDDDKLVLANRKKFAAALNVDYRKFTTCQQVHGSQITIVDEKLVGSGALNLENTIKNTDALITNLSGVPLLLFYADCVPVLLADIKTGSIGLVHAGWRGSMDEITAKTVEAMKKEFGCQPENMIAAIAPSIGSCCYEVDDAVYSKGKKYAQCFSPAENGRYFLDLWQVNKLQLMNCGIKEDMIAIAQVCTNHNCELFCSYRGENGKTGRMGVCICKN